ncbi:MAG: hypothetical protein NZ610_05915 [Candidatus Bipolaricaulota bacterium]|nr:hypothetical protein [Candidatus Bipolaricaulota bacterium]MCS7274917.1 hypothetical protein [Candidatus Bipolaricaulota bacterium]MDW8110284.1 hypothetical protein [Candidatus Bipolaricaulota bacterium]
MALVALFAQPAFAAPISGQAIVSIFFEPANPGESKLDQIAMDVEAGLRLELFVGGLSLSSISIFSFKGPEFQAFELRAGMAIFMRHIGIFAPNIIEVSDDPFWTVSHAVPELPGCPPSCLTGLPLRMFLDDLASPLDLPKMLDPTLNEPLQFRKLISQIGIDLAGLRFSVTLLLANWGTPQSPSFETGLILEAGGLTMGGLEVLAQTYIGARQGWECFGECKPWERFFEGQVVSGFDFQQEKLIVRNLRISGITVGFELVFDFPSVGFSQLAIVARGALLGVLIQQEIVFDYQAIPSFLRWAWTVRWGEALFTLELIDPDGGTLDFSMKRFGLFMDWASITLRNELVLQDPFGLVHLIEIAVGLEPFQFKSQTVFLGGLINGFYTQKVRGEWRFIEHEGWVASGGIETQMRREYLLYVGPFVSLEFR